LRERPRPEGRGGCQSSQFLIVTDRSLAGFFCTLIAHRVLQFNKHLGRLQHLSSQLPLPEVQGLSRGLDDSENRSHRPRRIYALSQPAASDSALSPWAAQTDGRAGSVLSSHPTLPSRASGIRPYDAENRPAVCRTARGSGNAAAYGGVVSIEIYGPKPGSKGRLVLDWVRTQLNPVSMAQVADGLRSIHNLDTSVKNLLARLVETGHLQRSVHDGRAFFTATDLDPDQPLKKHPETWNDEEHQQFMAYWGNKYFEKQRRKKIEQSRSVI